MIRIRTTEKKTKIYVTNRTIRKGPLLQRCYELQSLPAPPHSSRHRHRSAYTDLICPLIRMCVCKVHTRDATRPTRTTDPDSRSFALENPLAKNIAIAVLLLRSPVACVCARWCKLFTHSYVSRARARMTS